MARMRAHRPTFLVAEPESPEGISARKLVLETAKFNVLTAYSADESVAILKDFPQVDAIVFHLNLDGDSCVETVKKLRNLRADIPVIALSPGMTRTCDGANEVVSSYDPQALLNLLRQRFGDPTKRPSHKSR